mmetsp:Transcript_170450/g.546568  ORF Transcript_170450/g.546568 Transcript_170450/m.546568 type:complete len:333 (-) Transcript_170450:830-1828(-)
MFSLVQPGHLASRLPPLSEHRLHRHHGGSRSAYRRPPRPGRDRASVQVLLRPRLAAELREGGAGPGGGRRPERGAERLVFGKPHQRRLSAGHVAGAEAGVPGHARCARRVPVPRPRRPRAGRARQPAAGSACQQDLVKGLACAGPQGLASCPSHAGTAPWHCGHDQGTGHDPLVAPHHCRAREGCPSGARGAEPGAGEHRHLRRPAQEPLGAREASGPPGAPVLVPRPAAARRRSWRSAALGRARAAGAGARRSGLRDEAGAAEGPRPHGARRPGCGRRLAPARLARCLYGAVWGLAAREPVRVAGPQRLRFLEVPAAASSEGRSFCARAEP